MTIKKHSEKFVNICNSLKYPRWHILSCTIEMQMQDYDRELDRPESEQDKKRLSFIRKSVYHAKQELKSINKQIFN